MVVKKLVKYVNVEDSNGSPVGSWAVESALAGVAKCKFCDSRVSYKSGKNPLTTHSETSKHQENVKKAKNSSSKQQINIDDAMKNSVTKTAEQIALEQKVKNFEITLARSISHHKISFEFVTCLTQHLKTYCSDSKVIDQMKMQRSKAEYTVRYDIGKTYANETIALLKKCDAFCIGFDESEINKSSELEILVKLADSDGIQMRHYKTIDLESGTAKVIVETLLEQFDEDGIDYKRKLISAMTDGCNTMQGRVRGVKVKLAKEIHQFIDLGSCNDHHISNAMKYGVRAFDPDVEHVVVDIYQDLGGAKEKGIKKKKDFEKVCQGLGLNPTPFKKYDSTRFRSIRECILPIVDNWEGINKYYSTLKKPTVRQQRVKAYFVDREYMSLLNLYFILASIRELIEGIDYFEMGTVLLHESRRKMEQLLRNQITKFHCESAVKKLDGDDDSDNESTVVKTGEELLKIDLDNADTLLNKKRIFIGQHATALIKDLDLSPKSLQLKSFFSRVQTYYKTVSTKLIEYFSTGLKSTELEYMSAFSPPNCQQVSTSHKIV